MTRWKRRAGERWWWFGPWAGALAHRSLLQPLNQDGSATNFAHHQFIKSPKNVNLISFFFFSLPTGERFSYVKILSDQLRRGWGVRASAGKSKEALSKVQVGKGQRARGQWARGGSSKQCLPDLPLAGNPLAGKGGAGKGGLGKQASASR